MKKNIKRNKGAKGFDAFRADKKVNPPKVEKKRFIERPDAGKTDPFDTSKPPRERFSEKKDSNKPTRLDSSK
ncbi:MAG: hypothetical protein HC817_15380, partial [Saprospiraceae bacterium]|nr:hypothetical protein [Saprospiraceae bacterium]